MATRGGELEQRWWLWALCAACALAWGLPGLWLGEQGYLRIHDLLEAEFVTRRLVALPGVWWRAGGTVSGPMGGVARAVLPSGCNVTVWLFTFLEPMRAYAVQDVAVRLIGAWGMARLCRRHLGSSWEVAALAGLLFGTLPLYTIFGLSVAGQPWVADAWMGLRAGRARLRGLAIFAVYALWSSLVLAGAFVWIALSLDCAAHLLRRRPLSAWAWLGLGWLGAVQLLAERGLLSTFWAPQPWHRSEFDAQLWSSDLWGCLGEATLRLTFGHDHAAVACTALLGVALLGALTAMRQPGPRPAALILLRRLLAVCAAIALLAGFWHWRGLLPLKAQVTLLRSVQLDRFYFLLPALLTCAFALGASLLLPRRWGRAVLGLCVALQLGHAAWHSPDLTANWRALAGLPVGPRTAGAARYDAWFAPDLFRRVRAAMAEDGARILSVGVDPMVAAANGLGTIDGYLQLYPLAYKHAFRRVIAPMLARDSGASLYFDGWGNRCGVPRQEPGSAPLDVALDWQAARALGAGYVVAGRPLSEKAARGVRLVGHFAQEGALWNVWFYRIDGTPAVHGIADAALAGGVGADCPSSPAD